MPDARTIVTAPLAVARGLGFAELATLAAADALVRRAWTLGRAAKLVTPTLSGDLGGQYAFENHLAREGHDRWSLAPQEIANRRTAFEEDRRIIADEGLARLSVVADLGATGPATSAAVMATRTAFVKLFEEGLIEEEDRVVATCPRCRTSVGVLDAMPAQLEGERVTLRLSAANGAAVELTLCEPELLAGSVAVAVAVGHPAAGSHLVVPIADRVVPVVSDSMQPSAAIVVPAHDGAAHALARAHGWRSVPVLDEDGTVVAPGPLAGLGRYAARAAAKGLLDAEGVLSGVEPALEAVWRCGCCGTVLVPHLGRHWFLRAADLEVDAADAVRNGLVAFSPSDTRDAFLGCAGLRTDWCITTLVETGIRVPAARCLDCGKLTVDVEPCSSCSKCMGPLAPQPLSVDARFFAAIWALGLAGWPGDSRHSGARVGEAVVVVSSPDLEAWVLPAIALGLRLMGVAPFARVVVHPWPAPVTVDEAAFADPAVDPRAVRLALVAGAPDTAAAAAAVAALDEPRPDQTDTAGGPDAADVVDAVTAGLAALDDYSPAQAAALLISALSGGVPAGAAERLRALATPLLGD